MNVFDNYVNLTASLRGGGDRLSSLILLYVHKYIELNNEHIIDKFARNDPGRMLFLTPLGDLTE
jgi:hypothetical protein